MARVVLIFTRPNEFSRGDPELCSRGGPDFSLKPNIISELRPEFCSSEGMWWEVTEFWVGFNGIWTCVGWSYLDVGLIDGPCPTWPVGWGDERTCSECRASPEMGCRLAGGPLGAECLARTDLRPEIGVGGWRRDLRLSGLETENEERGY